MPTLAFETLGGTRELFPRAGVDDDSSSFGRYVNILSPRRYRDGHRRTDGGRPVRHISRPFSFALNDFNFDRPERTVIGRVFDRTVSRAAIYSAQRAFPSRPSPAIPSPPPTFRHRLRNNHVVVPRRYLSSPPRMIIITRHEINVTCCVRPVTTFFRPNPANGPKAIVSAFYVARYGLVNYLP